MLSTLTTIVAFIVAFGVIVLVHEFGHYWVARRLGVKVVKFSIGFGSALYSRRMGRDQTEYAISVLPLGGYVKMLDEREGEVDETERPRAFNRQSLPKRAAILAAGPVFNFILAVLVYWLVYMAGVPGVKPVVGAVTPESPAAVAGVRQGDLIVSVEGSTTPTWRAAQLGMVEAVMGDGPVTLKVRDPNGAARTLRLHIADREKLTQPGALLPGLGLAPWQLPAVIGKVIDGSPAAAAGLRVGDKVVASDDQPVRSWPQWVNFIRERPNQTVPITVRRDGVKQTLQLHIGAMGQGDQRIGHIGAGVRVPEGLHEKMAAVQQYGPLPALGRAFSQTGEISWLTLKMFWGMVTGQASLNNLSGPIGIAQMAGNAASAGMIAFSTFIALLSLSLGILNLLPIPVLDGGHLLYCAMEWVKGGPLSMRAQVIGQQIGLTLLLALVGFTVFNDLTRIAG